MLNSVLTFLEDSQLDPITDWLRFFTTHNGIFAPILLLMLEEAGIPLPVPGDIYVAYTGYLVSRGILTYFQAFILLLSAVLIGSSILYYLSAKYGQKLVLKYGQLIHLDEKKLVLVEDKFRKYGILVIIFGRHIPGFRVPITVFSGISGISYRNFIFSTFVSVVFWIAFYLELGGTLGRGIFKLLHQHNIYYLAFAIPFLIIFGPAIYMLIRTYIKEQR